MTNTKVDAKDSGVSFPVDAVDPKVKDLGLLIGLLQPLDGTNLAVNLEWFEDPVSFLVKIPDRRDDFLNLLRDFLGTPAEGTPDGADWFAINWEGSPSGVYVVLPKAGDELSPIGVGLWHDFSKDSDEVQISVWLLAPLFNLPLGSGVIVTGSAHNPVVAAIAVKDSKQVFSSEGTTFSGLQFEGNITFSGAPSFELSFLEMTPPAPQSNVATLADLLAALTEISNWANVILRNDTVVGWLKTDIPSTTRQIGDVLGDLGFLKGNAADGFTFGDFSSFIGKTPLEIAELLVSTALKVLASRTDPIVKLGSGGIYIVEEDASAGVSDFGLRLQVQDIGSKVTDNKPELKLQLGKWLTGENDDANWVKRADPAGTIGKPGISLYLVRETANEPSFHPRVELVSIGFDVKGGGTNPLVDVSGFKLGGFEPRFDFSLDFADLSRIPWGLAVRFDDLGLPLGAGLAGSSNKNPVAQNLLSSGSGEQGAPKGGTEGPGAEREQVNPAFSAAIAKIFDPAQPHTDVNFQLYSSDNQLTDTVWLPVSRSFGPLTCQRVGAEWPQPNENDVLSVLFDGSVKTSALEVDLKGLSVGIPFRTPGDLSAYSFGLEGLDFMLRAGVVEISGGLLESKMTIDGEEITLYNGTALIKAGVWSIQALGSWAQLNGHPSLFIFAFIDIPIGGPPVFFVTGLSVGFGYNRSINLPGQDTVQDFPLLAGLTDPSKIGGKDATPGDALNALQEFVPPAQGVNWVAAGVQFTSFELINSNALLIVEFGREFEIAVLGLSRIKLPQVGPLTFAYAELALEVIIAPDEGVFSATAVLTPNSYVLDPNCHLTGGFGFFVWYGNNVHAGDFVLTIGGYISIFKKPAWYPDEPRLGFNWQVSDVVSIKGGVYFALTPSCVMGGGALDIEFHAGGLRAWFTAHADFLIQWKPVYFFASVGVSIGISLRLDILFIHATITLEIGADLSLWGPPTGGIAHIHLWIFSFAVSFGAEFGAGMNYLSFDEFRTMLPVDSKKTSSPQPLGLMAAAEPAPSDGGDDAILSNACTIVLNAGQLTQQAPPDRWMVHADDFVFTVQTAVPLTELDLTGPTGKTTISPPNPDHDYFVGVRPMGISALTSVMSITVTCEPGTSNAAISDLGTSWLWSQRTGRVPEAVWGAPIAQANKGGRSASPPPTPGAAAITLPGRLLGLEAITPTFVCPHGPDPISEENLAHDPINPDDDQYLPSHDSVINQPQPSSAATLSTIAATIDDDTDATSPASTRKALFAALAGLGYDAGSNGTMADVKANIDLSFPVAPMLGSPVSWPVLAKA